MKANSISEIKTEMFRFLETEYFEKAYKHLGYVLAEDSTKEFVRNLEKEWTALISKTSHENAVRSMAKRHGYKVPENRTENGNKKDPEFGPECWAKYTVDEYENILKKVSDSLHGNKSESNAKRQLKTAVDKAWLFVRVKPGIYDVEKHGEWISESEFNSMLNKCKEIVAKYAAVSTTQKAA